MLPANPIVRPASPGDLNQLASLRNALWPDSSTAEHAQELALILAGKPPTTLPLVIFVAETPAGTLAGFVEAGLRSHAEGCDESHAVGYVEGWYVSDSHRRQGIGTALLRAAEDWARTRSCRELASDTPLSNTLSQKVHVSLGFQVVERAVLFRNPL